MHLWVKTGKTMILRKTDKISTMSSGFADRFAAARDRSIVNPASRGSRSASDSVSSQCVTVLTRWKTLSL